MNGKKYDQNLCIGPEMIFDEQKESCHDRKGKRCIVGKEREIETDKNIKPFYSPWNKKTGCKFIIFLCLNEIKAYIFDFCGKVRRDKKKTFPVVILDCKPQEQKNDIRNRKDCKRDNQLLLN